MVVKLKISVEYGGEVTVPTIANARFENDGLEVMIPKEATRKSKLNSEAIID